MRVVEGGFIIHSGRGLASLLAVAIVAAACGQAETSAQTSAPSQSSGARPSPANSGTTGAAPILLEFDLPDEFRTQPVGSADAVTGFRVGYFRANDPTAI